MRIVTAHGLIGKPPYTLLWSVLVAVGVCPLPIDAQRLERHALAVRVLLHKPEEG